MRLWPRVLTLTLTASQPRDGGVMWLRYRVEASLEDRGAERGSPMAFLDLAALLLTLAAALGWLNRKILKLPHEIGLVVTGLMMAMVLVLGRTLLPGNTVSAALADTLKRIDFTDLVMNGMLAFLVFAGAFSLDLRALRHRAVPVAALAVIGTMASTAVVGIAFWAAARRPRPSDAVDLGP